MSGKPTGQEPPDELDAEYRRLAAHDASAPSESVRQAVHDYAARLAQERADAAAAARAGKSRAARPRLWPGALFGTLAAAALAAVMIAPRLMTPPTSPSAPAAPQELTQVAADAHGAQSDLAESARAGSAYAPAAAAAPPPAPELAKSAPPNVRALTQSAPALARVQSTAPQHLADSEARSAKSVQPESPAASDLVAGASANRAPPAAALSAASPAYSGSGLIAAAARGDLAGARAYLDEGADVNSRDGAGRTALLLAAQRGHAEVVTLLLAAGADPNLADAQGLRPLSAADAGGYADIAAALRSRGAH